MGGHRGEWGTRRARRGERGEAARRRGGGARGAAGWWRLTCASPPPSCPRRKVNHGGRGAHRAGEGEACAGDSERAPWHHPDPSSTSSGTAVAGGSPSSAGARRAGDLAVGDRAAPGGGRLVRRGARRRPVASLSPPSRGERPGRRRGGGAGRGRRFPDSGRHHGWTRVRGWVESCWVGSDSQRPLGPSFSCRGIQC